MKKRSRRKVPLLLSALILAAGPVQADPITLGRASQLLALQIQSDPRIAGVRHERAEEDASWPGNPFRIIPETSMRGRGIGSNSLLSGVAIGGHLQQQAGLDNIAGDVQGTVCDCGEIIIAGGGFPKWPLFFLGAIPLFFIHGGEEVITTTFVPPVPTSTIPPPSVIPQVPEYASLLLFGTGLIVIGAFGRQTFRRKQRARQVATTEGH